MKRREFLKRTGKAAALLAVAGDVSLLTSGCSYSYRSTDAVKPDFEVPADPSFPKVVLAKNEDHVEALRASLDTIGGIARFVKPGEKVLLKPNVAFDRKPEQAVNTNPVLVGEMVRQCVAAGASAVWVTDYGLHDPEWVFSRCGIREEVERNGGEVLILNEDDFVETDLKGKFITTWPVLERIFEIDRLINMPIAKHHGMVAGTASMKNFFGAISGRRSSLHRQINQAIVDLAAYFRPTLTVIDATRVLIRHGPQGGSLADVRVFDSVICATDQVAADSRASEFLNIRRGTIAHVALAAEQGLGEIDYRKAGYVEIIEG